MPERPLRPCAEPGCPALVENGRKRCTLHQITRPSNWDQLDSGRQSASKRGYSWKWQQIRKRYLRTHPRCVQCGRTATVIDHITPHRGDQSLFWSEANWQALCHNCHAIKTAGGR